MRVAERDNRATSSSVHGMAVRPQVLDDGVEVAGVPQHDGVEHQAEHGELVFLAFAVGLADLAALAVEDLAASRCRDSCTVSWPLS